MPDFLNSSSSKESALHMEIRTAAIPYSQGMQAWKLTQALLPSTFSDRREKERSCFKETPHFAAVDFGHFKVNCKVVDCIFS